MSAINTVIRHWCETCQKFTRSKVDSEGYEICAKHVERDPDEDDW